MLRTSSLRIKVRSHSVNIHKSFTSIIDKTILVPLTNSLYVPGKLCDVDYVIVDVGTGYYVRKVRLACFPKHFSYQTSSQTRKQAIKHYTDKVGYIQTNIDSLEEAIQKKRENMNYLVTVMQSKIQAQAGGKP